MNYNKNMAQRETTLVTNRYKVTEDQDRELRNIEQRIGIAPSMIVRLALDILLPRIQNENIKDIDEALSRIFKQ